MRDQVVAELLHLRPELLGARRASCASVSARPWLTCTLRPCSARTSLFSWLPGTHRACPAATMPITSRSTPGVSGPRSTRSPTNTARRPSGCAASTGPPSVVAGELVAEPAQQRLQLDAAAVHVADHVERAVLVPEVVEQLLRATTVAAATSSARRAARGPCGSPPWPGRAATGAAGRAAVARRAAPKSRSGARALRCDAQAAPAGRARSRPAARRGPGPARPAAAGRRAARWSRRPR